MATINAATNSLANVQTAVNSAANGDTVMIPAGTGTVTWSGTLSWSGKYINLQGPGQSALTITAGTSTIINVTLPNSGGVNTISHMSFDCSNGDYMIQMNGGFRSSYRLHHLTLYDTYETAIALLPDGRDASGIVDHCTIYMPASSGGSKSIRCIGTGPEEHQPFGWAVGLGTNAMTYVEDNTFVYGGHNDGAMDSYAGARYVFRYNTVTNTNIEHHGADSGTYRGTLGFEVYNNTFTNSSPSMRAGYFRSGTGVIFNNTYGAGYSSFSLVNYRCDENVPLWGQCNGSSTWDQNTVGMSGYACLDQIGHVFGTTSGGSNTLTPLYCWNNVINGGAAGWVTSEHNSTNYIVANRDYYTGGIVAQTSATSPFNGTSGVGFGLLARRPTTCTTGVAYWATDTSTLYTATATNTWSTYYTPYTYPHPLNTDGGTPPTGTIILSVR